MPAFYVLKKRHMVSAFSRYRCTVIDDRTLRKTGMTCGRGIDIFRKINNSIFSVM